MTRESFLILLGVLVALSPFSGFPLSWLAWILPILGILIVGVSITLRRARSLRSLPTE
jgi:hypothetical protein